MAEPVHLDELSSALALGSHELLALVGGGGKTTALFALGRRLPGTVVLTTTTKMNARRTEGFEVRMAPSDEALAQALGEHRRVLVWGREAGAKAIGFTADRCDHWYDVADHVVVEADGSRQLPCKAPGPFEPVLPTRTTTAIACVGAGSFGRIIADCCHRPLRVAALAGCSPYERLTPPRLARLLGHERGGRKALPPNARFVVLLCRVTADDGIFADRLEEELGDTAEVIAVAPVRPQ